MQNSLPANTSDLLSALRELDAGIHKHTTWLKSLHRSLVCNSPPGEEDVLPDAHCHCQFGLWYYGQPHPELRERACFESIGTLHQAVHDNARALLCKSQDGQVISTDEYNQFMDTALQFKFEVGKLQGHIINQICVVDHLTGVWNRSGMQHKLEEEHDRMVRGGQPCCVCMVDLDDFKRINDTYGHPVGDQVLRATTQLLNDKLRKYDAIFRYGGEEFLLCLPGSVLEDALVLMERLRSELAALPIEIKDKGVIHVSASFGLAMMSLDENVASTIEQADHALLSAKANGRNRVCVWRLDGRLP
ncbi:MAG: diguanylate cyclase [Sulfurimicrobium sp.]|jgi:diguanylate cyclase (GGDEF)-like protein|nr:diguanylate cyclase [Sulfurimicrobium sp.]MDP1705036.1 diguanylate cyclase [Sulfurimicrobium sp.]MDP2198463.1 diguanylate cyclase [Sulfurimicrobium sp.]MDP2961657.1 diguanylate cyclase [Sulfurimicrobium sp.]MDP3689316.1 diguanylate cyclase [Sulfurimicrobium sp.]